MINLSPKGSPKSIIDQIKRYFKITGWFWQDAYRRFLGKVAFVLTYSLLAAACLAGALGVIFFYIHSLESGDVLSYANYSVQPRNSIPLLATTAIAALCLFALSFGFRYAANIQALGFGRLYEEFCAKRAIVLLANHGGHPDAQGWFNATGQMIQGDPRYCGRVARITVNMFIPLLVFSGTFVALFWLDILLTLIIFLLLVLALPALYNINIGGARHSLALERHARSANKVRRSLITAASASGRALTQDSPELERAFSRGPIARALDAYIGRLRTSDNSELLTNIVMGIALALILAIKGSSLLATGQGWGELAAYIVALRFNLQSLSQASKILTNVNRFYPQVARHFSFVQAMKNLPIAPASSNQIESNAVQDDDE